MQLTGDAINDIGGCACERAKSAQKISQCIAFLTLFPSVLLHSNIFG